MRLKMDFTFISGTNVKVAMESTLPSPTIFYTLDGSAPSAAAILYQAPVTIASNVVITAVAYGSDFSTALAGPHTISFRGQVLLSIEVRGQGHVQKDPDLAGYFPGERVALIAVPAPFFEFLGWLDGFPLPNARW